MSYVSSKKSPKQTKIIKIIFLTLVSSLSCYKIFSMQKLQESLESLRENGLKPLQQKLVSLSQSLKKLQESFPTCSTELNPLLDQVLKSLFMQVKSTKLISKDTLDSFITDEHEQELINNFPRLNEHLAHKSLVLKYFLYDLIDQAINHHLFKKDNQQQLTWCGCDSAPFQLQISLILCQLNALVEQFPPATTKPLVHTAFAEGEAYGLHTYLFIYGLLKIGYEKIHINFVDITPTKELETKIRFLIKEKLPNSELTFSHYNNGSGDYLRDSAALKSHSLDVVDIDELRESFVIYDYIEQNKKNLSNEEIDQLVKEGLSGQNIEADSQLARQLSINDTLIPKKKWIGDTIVLDTKNNNHIWNYIAKINSLYFSLQPEISISSRNNLDSINTFIHILIPNLFQEKPLIRTRMPTGRNCFDRKSIEEDKKNIRDTQQKVLEAISIFRSKSLKKKLEIIPFNVELKKRYLKNYESLMTKIEGEIKKIVDYRILTLALTKYLVAQNFPVYIYPCTDHAIEPLNDFAQLVKEKSHDNAVIYSLVTLIKRHRRVFKLADIYRELEAGPYKDKNFIPYDHVIIK